VVCWTRAPMAARPGQRAHREYSASPPHLGQALAGPCLSQARNRRRYHDSDGGEVARLHANRGTLRWRSMAATRCAREPSWWRAARATAPEIENLDKFKKAVASGLASPIEARLCAEAGDFLVARQLRGAGAVFLSGPHRKI